MAGPEEDPEQFPGEVHMVPCGEKVKGSRGRGLN